MSARAAQSEIMFLGAFLTASQGAATLLQQPFPVKSQKRKVSSGLLCFIFHVCQRTKHGKTLEVSQLLKSDLGTALLLSPLSYYT